MARRAARQHLSTADLIIDLQLVTRCLIGVIGAVRHIKDLRLRPDELLRLAVTLDTPFHLERILFVNGRHLIDRPVTGRAAYALCDMNAVIEIDVLRKVVNAVPLDRFVISEACSDRLKVRSIGPKLAVAIHTRLGRRHTGGCGCLDRLMAISAVNTVIAHVMLVRELHRLLYFEVLSRQIGRPRKLRPGVKTNARQQYNRDHADLRNVIGALSKDLCHLKTRSSSAGSVKYHPDQVEFFANNQLSKSLPDH